MALHRELAESMPDNDICETGSIDRATVEKLRQLMPNTAGLADIYRALADDTRVKIVCALLRQELCVCDVAAVIETSVATASHHLRLLRQMGLARSRRDGKFVYYSLDDDHVRDIVSQGLAHVREDRRR